MEQGVQKLLRVAMLPFIETIPKKVGKLVLDMGDGLRDAMLPSNVRSKQVRAADLFSLEPANLGYLQGRSDRRMG